MHRGLNQEGQYGARRNGADKTKKEGNGNVDQYDHCRYCVAALNRR